MSVDKTHVNVSAGHLKDDSLDPRNRKPLHIVHTEALAGPGGQTLRVLNEASGMIARGHQVTLICRPDTFICKQAKARGIPTQLLPLKKKNIQTAIQLRDWLKRTPHDIINTHSSADSWVVALAQLGMRNRAPVVRTRHTLSPVGRNWKSRWLYTRASQFIVTTGEGVRQRLITKNGYDGSRIRSLPSGIDHSRFEPGDQLASRRQLGLPLDKTVIGMVSMFSTKKGYEDLINAAGLLTDDNLHWVLVGDENRGGEYRSKLKELAKTNGVADQITFAGFQSDVAPWFQSMDIFCLPTFAREGVPQVLLQAMLCRLPIVTTPMGSIPDAIEHMNTGLMIEPKNPESLAGGIRMLTDDPQLGKTLSERAYQKALSEFTQEVMLNGMEEVFFSLLKAR